MLMLLACCHSKLQFMIVCTYLIIQDFGKVIRINFNSSKSFVKFHTVNLCMKEHKVID